MFDPYRYVIKPVVTEKSTDLAGKFNQYTFIVSRDANKTSIKLSIEEIFKVKVKDLKVINVKGKPKRMGKNVGLTSSFKKAVITLMPGNKIEIFEGVQ